MNKLEKLGKVSITIYGNYDVKYHLQTDTTDESEELMVLECAFEALNNEILIIREDYE